MSRSSNAMLRSLYQSLGNSSPSSPCRWLWLRPLTSTPARQTRGPRASAIWHQYIDWLGIPVERRSLSVFNFYAYYLPLRKEFYSFSVPIPFLWLPEVGCSQPCNLTWNTEKILTTRCFAHCLGQVDSTVLLHHVGDQVLDHWRLQHPLGR